VSGEIDPSMPRSLPVQGQRVAGKYEVERVLGHGGMGVVVAARHVQLGQRVAIKFLRGYAATDPNAGERFLREARASVALTSEHATKVLDVGTDESGEPYMVMEYLAGSDLTELLHQRGSLGIQETIDIVLQASEAIAEAHSRGIVHRDLKPPNLFLTTGNDGRRLVKVLDFGISKSLGSQTSQNLTASGSLMGSPAYMSPEQVRAPKTVDARTDVWALGIILYELLTGKGPFIADTLGETLARIVTENPPSILDLRPEVPAGLAQVIARCLEREPSRRVQSVADLASMLAPFAPRDSELSIERILRINAITTGASQRDARVETQASPPGPPTPASLPKGATLLDSSARSGRVATATGWQTSGSLQASFRRRSVGRTAWIGIVAGVLVLAGGAAALALRGGPSADAPKVATKSDVPSPSVALALPAPIPKAEPAAPEPAVTQESLPPNDMAAAYDSGWPGGRAIQHEPRPYHDSPSPTPAYTARKRAPLPPAQSATNNEKDIF
jgi:serine/threonine-protein kinase